MIKVSAKLSEYKDDMLKSTEILCKDINDQLGTIPFYWHPLHSSSCTYMYITVARMFWHHWCDDMELDHNGIDACNNSELDILEYHPYIVPFIKEHWLPILTLMQFCHVKLKAGTNRRVLNYVTHYVSRIYCTCTITLNL